jgi:hypothetical protein
MGNDRRLGWREAKVEGEGEGGGEGEAVDGCRWSLLRQQHWQQQQQLQGSSISHCGSIID